MRGEGREGGEEKVGVEAYWLWIMHSYSAINIHRRSG